MFCFLVLFANHVMKTLSVLTVSPPQLSSNLPTHPSSRRTTPSPGALQQPVQNSNLFLLKDYYTDERERTFHPLVREVLQENGWTVMDEICEFLQCLGHPLFPSSFPAARCKRPNVVQGDECLFTDNVFPSRSFFSHPGWLSSSLQETSGGHRQRFAGASVPPSTPLLLLRGSFRIRCGFTASTCQLPESHSLSYVRSLPCFCKFFRTCYCSVWWQIVFSFFAFHVHYCVNVLEPK